MQSQTSSHALAIEVIASTKEDILALIEGIKNASVLDDLSHTQRAQIANASFSLAQQGSNLVVKILQNTNHDSPALAKSAKVLDGVFELAKHTSTLAGAALSDESDATAKAGVELASSLVSLSAQIASMQGKGEIPSAISQAFEIRKDAISELASSLAQNDAKSLTQKAVLSSEVFELLAQSNAILADVLKVVAPQSELSDVATSLVGNILSASSHTSLALASQSGELASHVVDAVGALNLIVQDSFKLSGADTGVIASIQANFNDALSGLKQNAIAIANANASTEDGQVQIVSASLGLIEQTKDFIIKTIAQNTSADQKTLDATSKFASALLDLAQKTTNLSVAKTQEQKIDASFELAKGVSALFSSIKELGAINEPKSQILAKNLNQALDEIRGDAKELAMARAENDTAKMATTSLSIISKANGILGETLVELDIKPQIAKPVSDLASSAISAASNSVSLLYANGDSQTIAQSSIALIKDANSLFKGVLDIAGANNALSSAANIVISNLGENEIQNTANLIESIQANDKIGIALHSLNAINQLNGLINQITQKAELSTPLSNQIQSLNEAVLNTASSITKIISASQSEDKEAIAIASLELIQNANHIATNAEALANIDNQLVKNLHQNLDKALAEVKQSASALAQADPNTQEGRATIAKESFDVIKVANNMLVSSLDSLKLDAPEATSVPKLINSVLDSAKFITDLVVLDDSGVSGKIAVALGGISLATSLNGVIKDVLEVARLNSPEGENAIQIADDILNLAKANLSKLGAEITAIAEADPLSQEGTNAIANGAINLTSGANSFAVDAINKFFPESAGSAPDGMMSNIFDIARSVATLCQSDASSTNGKAAIASTATHLAGDMNALVGDILNLAGVAGKTTEFATTVVDGSLASVSAIIGSAIRLADWGSLSQADQIALGFDVGLKSIAAIGAGMNSVGQAVETFLGSSSLVPEVGGVLSAAALAISPLEIKSLADEHANLKAIQELAKTSSQNGYAGDALLADLLGEKFALDVAYSATNITLNVASTGLAAAAAASVVGAPIAAVIGVVKGAISGIMMAVKQPSLELIASRYTDEIKSFEGGVSEFFAKNTQMRLDELYSQKEVQDHFLELAKRYDANAVVSLDGVSISKTAIDLAAMTKLNDSMDKATNYATMISEKEVKHISFDNGTGTLNIDSDDKMLIKFNSPLFAPGSEEASREKVGKNQYYTKLALKGPDAYTINDGEGSNMFISNDKYAHILYDANGNEVRHIGLIINAGAGDDGYLADAGYTQFNGGEGIDSISYESQKIASINLEARQNGEYAVFKNVIGADVAVENIKTTTTKYGKRTETTQYREISAKQQDIQTLDELSDVEIITASKGDDILSGGKWADTFDGGAGNDILRGNEGNDTLYGAAGDDKIYGGAGNDVIVGGSGSDTLYGDKGNDRFIQTDLSGNDFINGGAGADTLSYTSLNGAIVADLAKTQVQKIGAEGVVGIDSVINVENVEGSKFDDIIKGNHHDNVLKGNAGNDILISGGGTNELIGGAGTDTYIVNANSKSSIMDSEGYLKILNNDASLRLEVSEASTNHTRINFTQEGKQVGSVDMMGKVINQTIAINDDYIYDLKSGKFKFILDDARSESDLSAKVLKFNAGEALDIEVLAKQSSITLDSSRTNHLSFSSQSIAKINGFKIGEDDLSFGLKGLESARDVKIVGDYAKDGADLTIKYASASITLIGAGSSKLEGIDEAELHKQFLA